MSHVYELFQELLAAFLSAGAPPIPFWPLLITVNVTIDRKSKGKRKKG